MINWYYEIPYSALQKSAAIEESAALSPSVLQSGIMRLGERDVQMFRNIVTDRFLASLGEKMKKRTWDVTTWGRAWSLELMTKAEQVREVLPRGNGLSWEGWGVARVGEAWGNNVGFISHSAPCYWSPPASQPCGAVWCGGTALLSGRATQTIIGYFRTRLVKISVKQAQCTRI